MPAVASSAARIELLEERDIDGVRLVSVLLAVEADSASLAAGHRGLVGGEPSAPGRNRVERAGGVVDELGGCAAVQMNPGDVFVIETPGGGGYGR